MSNNNQRGPVSSRELFLSLPRLLALPFEIQEEIMIYLINSGDPGLGDLRVVNKYFYCVITHEHLRQHAVALIAHRKLTTTEHLKCLKVDDQLPCSLSLSLLPTPMFLWNSRTKALGSKQATPDSVSIHRG